MTKLEQTINKLLSEETYNLIVKYAPDNQFDLLDGITANRYDAVLYLCWKIATKITQQKYEEAAKLLVLLETVGMYDMRVPNTDMAIDITDFRSKVRDCLYGIGLIKVVPGTCSNLVELQF